MGEMVSHAQEEAPNECCGILAGVGGRVTRLYRAANAEKSPVRYNIAPEELLQIYRDIEGNGWDIIAIYHSHAHTEAYPSASDVELAFWPDALYLIVSLKGHQPLLRAFRIVEGQVVEEEVKTVADEVEQQASP